MFEKTDNSKTYPEKGAMTLNNETTERSALAVPEDPENERNKPKIPDGGWGWMVVGSSLLIHLIQDGISFSLGLLQPRFVAQFQASQSACAWIGSLFISMPLLLGPFYSIMVDKYGCRAMTLLAGLISASGLVISSFVNSIEVMYLTFGVISGLGLGFTYITAIVSIAFWFDRKRNLAVGLGACGTGIGTIVYAPLTNILLEYYGWRGTLIILAGTLLHMCACGALMRDPDWLIKQNKLSSSKSSSDSNISVQDQKLNLRDFRSLLKSGKEGEFVLQTLATSIERKDKEQKTGDHHHQSVLNLPTFIKQNETVPVEVLEQLSENKKLYNVIVQNYPSILNCRSTSERGLNTLVEDPSKITRVPVTFSLNLKKTDKPKALTHQYSIPEDGPLVMEPLMANEKKPKIAKSPHVDKGDTPWLVKQFSPTTTHQSYFKNMRLSRHSITHRSVILNTNKYKIRASSCPNIYRVSMTSLVEDDERWYDEFTKSVSLFYEFHFFLMSLSTIILFAWFMTPYMFIPDHMEQSGYSSDEASIVLSVTGAANTIGMVLLGWAGDQSWCNVQKTYGACLLLCGACCSAMYFATGNYIVLNMFAVLYGVSLGSCFSFTPVLLVELLPLDTFTKAYGLTLLCQGVGHLVGPPLAGLIRDLTGSWSLAFHLSGAQIILAGVLILLIPYTKNRKLIGSGPLEKELEMEKS